MWTNARLQLENLLEAHPDLHVYQEEIERILMNSGDTKNRLSVLEILIESNLIQLRNQLSLLLPLVSGDTFSGDFD